MVRPFSPARPAASDRGLVAASRVSDVWKSIGSGGGGGGPDLLYETNFSEYTVGDGLPSDWSDVGESGGTIDVVKPGDIPNVVGTDRALELSLSSSSYKFLIPDGVQEDEDTLEILGLVYSSSNDAQDACIGLDISAGSNGIMSGLRSTSSSMSLLLNDGAFDLHDTVGLAESYDGVWHWSRLRRTVEGSDIRIQSSVWPTTDEEPVDWMHDNVVTPLSSQGVPGVFARGAVTHRWAYLAMSPGTIPLPTREPKTYSVDFRTYETTDTSVLDDFTVLDTNWGTGILELVTEDGETAANLYDATRATAQWDSVLSGPRVEILGLMKGDSLGLIGLVTHRDTEPGRIDKGFLTRNRDSGGVGTYYMDGGSAGFGPEFSVGSSVDTSVWHYQRLRFDGDNQEVSLKIWLPGDPEPSSFDTIDISSDPGGMSSRGGAGISGYGSNFYYRWLSASEDFNESSASFLD